VPGWKYEYSIRVGADTKIRPFGPHYRIIAERRAVPAPWEIRSVRWRDLPALRQAFAEAFADYTDYIYSTPEQLLRVGGALLRKFFARVKDDLCRRASCLAIDPENPGRVIGAASLAPANGAVRRLPENATQLQPVFVVPGWRRRGVATALVSEVLGRLWNAGQEVLISGCSDYNVVSKRWHLAFGVTEERRYYARRPLFYWVRNELWRRAYLEKRRGIPFEPLERAKLERWFMALADELDRLERRALIFHPVWIRGVFFFFGARLSGKFWRQMKPYRPNLKLAKEFYSLRWTLKRLQRGKAEPAKRIPNNSEPWIEKPRTLEDGRGVLLPIAGCG
jgi:GNAT superfamily N-acetyltransferase